MPRLPSEVAELHFGMRFTDGTRYDFDHGMLTFRNWADSKRNETVWGHSEEPPGKGRVRVQKYQKMADIFAEYDETWDASKFASDVDYMPEVDIEAVIEDAYGSDVLF